MTSHKMAAMPLFKRKHPGEDITEPSAVQQDPDVALQDFPPREITLDDSDGVFFTDGAVLSSIRVKPHEIEADTERETTPAVENNSAVENEAPVDNSAVENNTSVDNRAVENNSAVENDAPVDNSAIENNAPVDNSAVENNAPVDNSAVENNAPVDNSAVENEAPVDNSAVENNTSVENDAPVDNSAVENDAPVDNSAVENNAPVDNSAIENDAPVDNSAVENEAPVDNSAVENKSVDNSAVENDAPVDNSAAENNGRFVERLPALETGAGKARKTTPAAAQKINTAAGNKTRFVPALENGWTLVIYISSAPLFLLWLLFKIGRAVLSHPALFVLACMAVLLPGVGVEGFHSCEQDGPCMQGEYQASNGTCLPCLQGTWWAKDNHSCTSCKTCSKPNPLRNQIVIANCTTTSDNLMGCPEGSKDNNYIDGDIHAGNDPYCSEIKANTSTVPQTSSSPGSVTPVIGMTPTTNSSWDNETTVEAGSDLRPLFSLIPIVVIALIVCYVYKRYWLRFKEWWRNKQMISSRNDQTEALNPTVGH